jgi:hypothetical protein
VTSNRDAATENMDKSRCEADRQRLAYIDNRRQFNDVMDLANRANVSFYPVDPRGLVVFDTPIDSQRTGLPAPGQPILPGPREDNWQLQNHQSTLHDMAAATDGVAITNTNDLDAGLQRIVADQSSYYLLGYYSTGKLDGKFHAIRVRVRRPGVTVRSRRGFLAASQSDLTAAAAAAVKVVPAPQTGSAAVTSAFARLVDGGGERALRITAATGWVANGKPTAWVAGDFAQPNQWTTGGNVDIALDSKAGETVATVRERVAAGARSVRVVVPLIGVRAGDYSLIVRAAGAGSARPEGVVIPVVLREAPASSGALMSRRGPASGNQFVPTGDVRFRRNEAIRIEIPATSGKSTARLLGRDGKPLAIPVSTSVIEDAAAVRWQIAELALAPLAAGDYAIEVAGSSDAVVAFRVVP